MVHNKLKGRIIQVYGSCTKFAEAIGKTKQTVSLKLHGESGFSKDDILEWCDKLSIPKDEIGSYFFTD